MKPCARPLSASRSSFEYKPPVSQPSLALHGAAVQVPATKNEPTPSRRLTLAGLGGLLALALVGCASPPPSPVPDARLWEGRLSLQVAGTPPQSFTAAFELQGDARSGRLLLNSPLGNTVATVRWRPGEALLHQADNTQVFTGLDQLTAQLTGTEVPVAALFAWLDGQTTLSAPGWQADLSQHAAGRLSAVRKQPLPKAELRVVFHGL